MKLIKHFCLEILSKVKDHIAAVIATAIVGAFLLIISFVFKTYLKNVYTFTFPLWLWVTIFAITATVPLLIAATIDARRRRKERSKRLSGKIDVVAALTMWITQQLIDNKDNPTTKHFKHSNIDDACGIEDGYSKIYIVATIKHFEEKGFSIKVLEPIGEETILIDFSKRNLAGMADVTAAIMEWLRKESQVCNGDTFKYHKIDIDCNIPFGSSKTFFSSIGWLCVDDNETVAKFPIKGDETIMMTFFKKESPDVTIPDQLK